ncbi:hypothetical protein JCM16303_001636 [Sporobolomyces ruberrimus]
MEFDPLNSPSRTHAEPVQSNSPFSVLFARGAFSVNIEPPLIDFTSSPSPPRPTQSSSFQPKPLSLASSARQNLFPPQPTSRLSLPPTSSSKLSILEDSFSDFPPSFNTNDLSILPSRLDTLREEESCDEGGLVSFIRDSPPPSLRRRQSQGKEKENTSTSSPTRRVSGGGKKWAVMNRLKEDRQRRRSRSLSPVKEAGNVASPYNFSAREVDSIAQIGNVDLSLIQDEGGSFLLADDDSTVGQSFENERHQIPARSPIAGDLSQIGEEEEEEDDEAIPAQKEVDEGLSVGLSTMFLNRQTGTYDVSLINDQSRFPGPFAGGGAGRTFDQSTLPRHFQPPPSSFSTKSFPAQNPPPPVVVKSTSILPPELVSPVKLRSNLSRPSPLSTSSSSSKKPFQNPLPTPAPSPPSSRHHQSTNPQNQSNFLSLPLPAEDYSFLKKSSQSFIKECKSPRKPRSSETGSEASESDSSGSQGEGGFGKGVGEMTEFGFTQMLMRGGQSGDMSTAILNQQPPTAVLNPESTRTIELCLQRPLSPDRSNADDEDEDEDGEDLSSSTRTVKPSNPNRTVGEEIDLMGMEEPSMLYQNQTVAFSGDITIENQSIVLQTREGQAKGEGKQQETGAERLKRRMAKLRAAQSLHSIPATPVSRSSTASKANSRFVSLLDQTPQVSHVVPRSAVRRPITTPSLTRSNSGNIVAAGRAGGGAPVGTLLSIDTPSVSRSTNLATPARSTTSRLLPRPSLVTPHSRSAVSQTAPGSTPGERKESTRARLERMRSERKQREEELLRKSESPEKPASTTVGGPTGVKRSNSVGNRSRGEGGIARSQSSSVIGATRGLASVGGGMKRAESLADVRATGGGDRTSTLTERMAASSSSITSATTKPRPTTTVRPRSSIAPSEMMPPPSLTSRRNSLLPPPSTTSTSKPIRRASLVPSSSSAPINHRSSVSSSSRPPLKSTIASSTKPAGSGSTRK